MPAPMIDTRALPLRDFAHLFNDESHINLLASTTEPTFQLYTGDGINISSQDEKKLLFGPRAGLCLEAGRPINAVNDPEAKKWVVLKEGEKYGSLTTYTAWVSK
jgi:aldose 1-epimerase